MMSLNRHLCVWSLPLVIAAGCVPAPQRDQTKVVKASDVKITLESKKTAAPAPAPSVPAASAPASEAAKPAEPAAEMPAAPAAAPAENPAAKTAEKTIEGPARLAGRVIVKGDAPKLPPLVQQGQQVKAPICSKEAVPDQSVVVGADGGLANVFVYLKRAPKGAVPAPSAMATELDQKGCVYIPHAQIMRVGEVLQLKNSDPVAHNVRISGRAASFNQTIPAGDTQGIEFKFTTPETLPAKVQCDFHGWMSAWILPIDHPWGTITDQNGNFEIGNLPEGELEFVVWQEKKGYIERSFKVTARQGHLIEHVFEVDASSLAQ